jgi:hypothetical protein
MHEQTPKNLPWLDRLAAYVPGYGGYLTRANRRAADRALRDAIAGRLATFRSTLEEAIRQCVDKGALTEINALERLRTRLDHVADRLRSAGSGTDSFYSAGDLDSAKAESLHGKDMALFERADALARHFDRPDFDHDRLASLRADLDEFEHKLDERALSLQGIH